MQILDSYKGYDFFSRSGGVVVFKGKEYVGFFENLNEAYDNVFSNSKEKKTSLRSMYEEYLKNVLEAKFIGDEFGYHGWSYFKYESKQVFDWRGEKVFTEVVKTLCQIWIGKNGGCYKDKNYKTKMDDIFMCTMKKWCWKKYFNIEI